MGSTNKVIHSAEPNISQEDIKAVLSTLKDNQISGRAPVVGQFEEAFAKYCGVKHAIAVNSGSSALLLSLLSFKFPIGTEVIVPDFAYIAVANAVVQAGLTPVLVDVQANGNIDPVEVERAITPSTVAVIAVHTYGHPADMDELNLIGKKYNLAVIEDAAEAHGAEYKGKKTGSLGTVGTFSFFANKTMTTGEGGMITTNLDWVAEEARKLRDQYFVQVADTHYWHPRLGYSLCMSGLEAALGLSQLARLDEFVKVKEKNAKLYDTALSKIRSTYELIKPLPIYKDVRSSRWMVAVTVSSGRNALLAHLRADGIEARNFFPCLHYQGEYKQTGHFPISEGLYEQGLYLPSGTTLTESDISKVVTSITTFYENRKGNSFGGA